MSFTSLRLTVVEPYAAYSNLSEVNIAAKTEAASGLTMKNTT